MWPWRKKPEVYQPNSAEIALAKRVAEKLTPEELNALRLCCITPWLWPGLKAWCARCAQMDEEQAAADESRRRHCEDE